MAAESTSPPIPALETEVRTPIHLRYFSLLRANRNFRRLWMAQLVSELGDWFYSLAVYDLLFQMTHSARAVSYAVITQTLPWFFMTPVAGVLVDRFSRRRLMIVSDIVQGAVVLGLLLVRRPSEVWLVYVLLGAEVIFASIFEPARNALVPNLARAEELLPANALSSATWSFTLMVGAALGGVATAIFGRPVAFIVNSLSFFVSAALLRKIQCEEPHLIQGRKSSGEIQSRSRTNALREGARYLIGNRKVVALILAKTCNGLLGGTLTLLVIFGERIYPIAGHGALAVGLLYAARGLGAGLGPLVGDAVSRGRESRMWRSISVSFFAVGLSYIAFSRAPNLWLALLTLVFAHMGASNTWVVSTTLLQMHTEDRLRGRVFAVDLGLLMLAVSTSNFILGLGVDTWKFNPRQLAAGFGALLIVPGFLWLPIQAAWAKAGRGEADPVA